MLNDFEILRLATMQALQEFHDNLFTERAVYFRKTAYLFDALLNNAPAERRKAVFTLRDAYYSMPEKVDPFIVRELQRLVGFTKNPADLDDIKFLKTMLRRLGFETVPSDRTVVNYEAVHGSAEADDTTA